MRSSCSFLGLAAATASSASAAALSSVCTTSYVQSVLPSNAIEGITISPDSVVLNVVSNYSVASSALNPSGSGLSFCNLTFSYTRDGVSNETTNVRYYLPSPDQWQGRYVSTGGGGFAITSGEAGLGVGIVHGAVTGTTDGGMGGWNAQLNEVVLDANGTIDYNMLFNFGYRSIHEMTVIGQALTKSFYNSSSLFSYYQGCSEGGREGWSQVQRYGTQFNGAAIGAPAFRMAFQQVAHLYSSLLETTMDYFPSSCEMERINNDTIEACDGLDGRVDGVVARTDLCKLQYSANSSLGNSYSCAASTGGGAPFRKRQAGGPPSGSSAPAANGTVSAQAVQLANSIWKGMFDSKGRQIYVSYQPSADFGDAGTTYNSNTSSYEVSLQSIGVEWVNTFLEEISSDSFSLANVTVDTLRAWILEGMQKYADTLTTTWPDLEDFSNSSGKVIHFHGESDPSIPSSSSAIYYEAVRKTMYPNLSYNDSITQMNDWYRFYLVPGAAHCGPSTDQPNGPFPQNVLGSVIDWVENGVNPELLNATVISGTTTDVNQKLCSFPLRPLWTDNSTMQCVYDQASIDTWVPDLDSIPVPVY